MTSILKKPPGLLKTQRVEVIAEGDLVVLRVGNGEIKMPYEDAFVMSQWLRIRAKEAKTFAGDTGRHWSAVAVITDANVTRN